MSQNIKITSLIVWKTSSCSFSKSLLSIPLMLSKRRARADKT